MERQLNQVRRQKASVLRVNHSSMSSRGWPSAPRDLSSAMFCLLACAKITSLVVATGLVARAIPLQLRGPSPSAEARDDLPGRTLRRTIRGDGLPGKSETRSRYRDFRAATAA